MPLQTCDYTTQEGEIGIFGLENSLWLVGRLTLVGERYCWIAKPRIVQMIPLGDGRVNISFTPYVSPAAKFDESRNDLRFPLEMIAFNYGVREEIEKLYVENTSGLVLAR